MSTQKPQQHQPKGQQTDCHTSSAGKACPGVKRKFSFLDAFSPEKRALFAEHARDDNDMPSYSGTQKAASTAAVTCDAAPTTTLQVGLAARNAHLISGDRYKARRMWRPSSPHSITVFLPRSTGKPYELVHMYVCRILDGYCIIVRKIKRTRQFFVANTCLFTFPIEQCTVQNRSMSG